MQNGLQSPRTEEAKYPAFSNISFTQVCVGLNFSGVARWMLLAKSGSSLLSIFQSGTYMATGKGFSAWKNMMSGSSLQYDCYKEGFNVKSGTGEMFARVGIVGDNDYDCYYPNSYIGVGTIWNHYNTCPVSYTGVSSGNLALCWPDNGEKSLAAFGFILIK